MYPNRALSSSSDSQRHIFSVDASSSRSPISPIRAVDVFCGIGGLTYGLRVAGVEVVLGIDIDASCSYAYETNNSNTSFLQADIRDVNFAGLQEFCGNSEITALVGCAPCQPFSSHNRRNAISDDSCQLVDEFARLVREGVPNFVSMENVPGLAKQESFRNLLKLLASLEYSVDHGVINFHRYGVPQRRRRLVLIASRCGPAVLPKPIDNTTVVADFIADLPPLEPGETALEDLAHSTLPLSPINLERIRQSKPGGTWKDWNDSLISPCHTRAHYPASYGRMEWDKPAPTITTQFCYYSTGRFGHPTQNRTLSVREAALLQTFPAEYALVDPDAAVPIRKLARHVGNAVPVKIGECIGSAMRRVSNHV